MSIFSGFGSAFRRPLIKWPVSILGAAAVLYGVAWLATAFILRDQIETWMERQRAAGAKVQYANPVMRGFPSRVEIALPSWDVTAPDSAGGWIWKTELLKVHTVPWQPFTFTVDLSGRHTVAGVWTPPAIAAVLTFDRAEVRPALAGDGRLRGIKADISGATVSGAAENAPQLLTISAFTLVAEPRAEETPENLNAWQLKTTLEAMRFPTASGLAPFSQDVRRFVFDADLVGPMAIGPLKDALDAWRQGGGTINLREFTLDWPPLTVMGTATVSLDERLQPIGAGTAKFRGVFETIDGLVEADVMRSSAGSMARIVLGLLSRTPAGGGPPELSISVTLQDNKLFAGPLTLFEFEPIDWDAATMRVVPGFQTAP